ncbi:hypothetical protein F25303_6849 [Fusarium sp. NRRL 25303]|nr:hypothetical protein F25303_6849 [Fusarium sp. NRRL 25303]
MDVELLGQDIRDELGLTRNLREICRNLQLQRPPGLIQLDSPSSYDTQGLDCIFALVRHIYSQLSHFYFNKDKHKDAEEKNQILALAWLDINFAAKDEWEQCKQNILKSFNPSGAHDPKISFEGLVNSQLMNDTFWNQEPWEHADLGPNPDAVRVAMGEIMVDRNKAPWWSFKQHMRSNFQLITTDNTTELRMCAKPCIIRAHYKTNKNLDSFPFSDLKNTYIPIAEVKGSEVIPNDRDCLYTLIAAVSLKDNRIRTYALEDKVDGDCMLFYCDAGDAVPDFGTEEVVVLPEENPNLAFVNDALQQDINKRREAKRVQREKEERDRE